MPSINTSTTNPTFVDLLAMAPAPQPIPCLHMLSAPLSPAHALSELHTLQPYSTIMVSVDKSEDEKDDERSVAELVLLMNALCQIQGASRRVFVNYTLSN